MLQIPQNNNFSLLNSGRKGDEGFSTASATLPTINGKKHVIFLNTSLTPSLSSNKNSDSAVQEFQQL